MLNAMKPLVAYGLYWNPSDALGIIGLLVSLIDASPEQFIRMGCIQLLIHSCLTFLHVALFPGDEAGKVELNNDKNKLLFKLKTK